LHAKILRFIILLCKGGDVLSEKLYKKLSLIVVAIFLFLSAIFSLNKQVVNMPNACNKRLYDKEKNVEKYGQIEYSNACIVAATSEIENPYGFIKNHGNVEDGRPKSENVPDINCLVEKQASTSETIVTNELVYENNSTDTIGAEVNTDDDYVATVNTEHVHNFVISSSCAYYPEEGHYEDICVKDGYTEEKYESYENYCYFCGSIMDSWSLDQILEHSSKHGSYGTYNMLVESIYHEPVYEKIWVIDKAEYYVEEEVIECIECGYIQ